MLRIGGGVLAGVVALFLLQGVLEMEASVAALAGIAVLLPLSRVPVARVVYAVEWNTLVFFMMLFILVGAVQDTGLLEQVARGVQDLSDGSLIATLLLILWISALASAVVDNIPLTATMLPVVGALEASFCEGARLCPNGQALWWALAIGAALGGNGTLVGASANIVTAGIAERLGAPITFNEFMRRGMPTMLATMLLATVYLLLRY